MVKDVFPKIITPEFRAVYVWIDKPQPPLEGGGEPKFKCGMLFDKKNKAVIAALKEIKATADGLLKEKFPKVIAADAAMTAKLRQTNPKAPAHSSFQPWLRDGDSDPGLMTNELFTGMYYIQAKSKDAPGVVDARRQPLMPPHEFYAGAYAIASCAMFTYDKAGNKGAGLLLNNIMKLRDGERLSGKPSAADDFADVEVPAGSVDTLEDEPF